MAENYSLLSRIEPALDHAGMTETLLFGLLRDNADVTLPDSLTELIQSFQAEEQSFCNEVLRLALPDYPEKKILFIFLALWVIDSPIVAQCLLELLPRSDFALLTLLKKHRAGQDIYPMLVAGLCHQDADIARHSGRTLWLTHRQQSLPDTILQKVEQNNACIHPAARSFYNLLLQIDED